MQDPRHRRAAGTRALCSARQLLGLLGLLCLLAGAALVAAQPAQAQSQLQSQSQSQDAAVTTPVALAASAPDVAPDVARLPARLFFRQPDIHDARLAPDGRHLALTMGLGERSVLAVVALDGDLKPRVVAGYGNADIDDFAWVTAQRLVYDVVDRQSGSGDQSLAPGLFAVNVDGSERRTLVRTQHALVGAPSGPGRQPLEPWHRLLTVPQDGSGEVIVGRPSGGSFERHGQVPLRLNTHSGISRSVGLGSPDGAQGWLFDPQGEPRVVSGQQEGQAWVRWRAPGRDDWVEIGRWPATRSTWRPHSVDAQGQLYVTVSRGPQGAAVLTRFDFAAGRPQAEPLVSTPGFDFSGGLVGDVGGGPVLGVRVRTDAETTRWFDARLQRWQDEADQRLPGRVNRLVCRRCNDADPVLLVHSWSDRHPGELWLLRPARETADAGPRWQAVGAVRRDVDPRRMATVDFHRVTARDGLSIPLWLTLPAGAARDPRPRPAVLLVHGGPWVRGGAWRWNGQAQFLASRGWVVIEPEFRGSTGYGARLFQAGRKQWGRAMQDDLVDALQWAVAQGHVDGKRVCIAGASYGGYAALMAPLRHPGVFRCAVSWAGVTDPRAMMNRWDAWQDFSDEVRRYNWPALVGDPQADAALLDEASPVRQAERWQIPLLLAYGGQDRRVPVAQGEAFRDALRRAGRPEPQWVVYADESHGWLKLDNRLDFAERMERFLAEHLR